MSLGKVRQVNSDSPSLPIDSGKVQAIKNGPRIPTKDATYENQRKKYEQTMGNLSNEIEALKARSVEQSEKLKKLLAGEEEKAERDAVSASLSKLRKQKDELMVERTSLAKLLEESIEVARTRTAELDAAREKLPCKRKEELELKITHLEKEIETGVSLTEEKRLVSEISKLNKSRRAFDSISSLVTSKDQIDAKIDTIRSKIKTIDSQIKQLKISIKNENDKFSELLSKKSNSTTAIQALKKSLEEIRSSIDEKFKQRTAAYEAFTTAKEDHKKWVTDRQEKYKTLMARRELEEDLRKVQKELESLSVQEEPQELVSLRDLKNFLSSLVTPGGDNPSKPKSSTVVPRQIEKLDQEKFKILEKSQEPYFEVRKNQKASISKPKASSYVIPTWAQLELEVHRLGPIRSESDVKDTIERIEKLEACILQASKDADMEKEEKRTQLRNKAEELKTSLSSIQ